MLWVPLSAELPLPTTIKVTKQLDKQLVPTGEVFFSVLAPGTHIPPHRGSCNFQLTLHLPLIVPGACELTVAGEARAWSEGRCLMFDATFTHEAHNSSDRPRVCLIMDVWHPQITSHERPALAALHAALSPFRRFKRWPWPETAESSAAPELRA